MARLRFPRLADRPPVERVAGKLLVPADTGRWPGVHDLVNPHRVRFYQCP